MKDLVAGSMLFNSIEFAIFLPVVFLLYWFVAEKNVRLQNAFILAASYFFYGYWDWRFLALIAFSSFIDYLVGIGLGGTQEINKKKILLGVSVCVNIGLLAAFKYFNFFLENFYKVFTFLGHPVADPFFLKIILPVGISFYTFQTLSYSIDVYRGSFKPTKDIISFFAFVSFFPQLVAGPIERAAHLLPQFFKKRIFEYDKAVDGSRQILLGLFKKVVIADNCAQYVNDIFFNYKIYSGSTLLLGAILFGFQIYCDFSGYSDIAIGTSRLFGFELKKNFAFPYFSRDIAEFWRRWHISLSTWFRDYVYIPLGGNRGTTWKTIRNILIVFLVSGFWHGANWTFIAWGGLHAVYILPLILLKKNRIHTDTVARDRFFPSCKEAMQLIITFLLTTIAWIFFRSENISQALAYASGVFSPSLLAVPEVFPKKFLLLIFGFTTMEWLQRNKKHALEFTGTEFALGYRWALYYGIVICVLFFGGKQQQFIYFQF